MKDAIFQFPTDGTPAECEQIKCGHINQTYLITTDTGAKYVLQWVNQYVFPNVDAIMGNMSAISAYLRGQNERMSMISYIDTRDGKTIMTTERAAAGGLTGLSITAYACRARRPCPISMRVRGRSGIFSTHCAVSRRRRFRRR